MSNFKSIPHKDFWMAKGSGNVTEGDSTLGNSSGVEQKRSHQWFVDSAEPQAFPNKKQAVRPTDGKSAGVLSGTDLSIWENSLNFQPAVQNQFISRLFGPEPSGSIDYSEWNTSPVRIDDTDEKRKFFIEHGEDTTAALSISHGIEDTQLSHGAIKKVRVNQVKDHKAPEDPFFQRKGHSNLNNSQECTRENETDFISIGNVLNKEINCFTLDRQAYNQGVELLGPTGSTICKADEITIASRESYSRGDTQINSFESCPDENNAVPICQSAGSNHQSYSQYVQTEPFGEKLLAASNASAAAFSVTKFKTELYTKNKTDIKSSRKEAPNSFPSNVRSLISTGMLDGVPVKYVSLSREELCGIIKGSGYLCGCQTCNFSKVLNAYEFERHANSKTKHPNNHIYFDNGKTIYQIVQELRSTPESLLFDAIQNAFGSPINQKAFCNWKESFQAATRELQRIYGKEELNL